MKRRYEIRDERNRMICSAVKLFDLASEMLACEAAKDKVHVYDTLRKKRIELGEALLVAR